jgi:hypothetical protein
MNPKNQPLGHLHLRGYDIQVMITYEKQHLNPSYII